MFEICFLTLNTKDLGRQGYGKDSNMCRKFNILFKRRNKRCRKFHINVIHFSDPRTIIQLFILHIKHLRNRSEVGKKSKI